MNDDHNFLTELRESPRREFVTELYQRINEPMYKKSAFNIQWQRPALAFAALALVLAITLLISPAARAFAGNQLRQIGAFLLRPDDGSIPEEPRPTVPAPSESSVQYADDMDAASALAGFAVLAPSYLPDGYAPQGSWSVDERDDTVYVTASFVDGNGRHFLLMNQTKFAENALFEQRYGVNETVTDVLVAGHTGVFISGRLMAHPSQAAQANDEQPDLLATNWLIWEVDGITYTLFGDGLGQSELIQIAESLSR